jgi:hypothetical protein
MKKQCQQLWKWLWVEDCRSVFQATYNKRQMALLCQFWFWKLLASLRSCRSLCQLLGVPSSSFTSCVICHWVQLTTLDSSVIDLNLRPWPWILWGTPMLFASWLDKQNAMASIKLADGGLHCVWFGGAESFHTLALDGVPVFGSHNRSSAYRFVTLVDVRPSLFLVIVNTCNCELGN